MEIKNIAIATFTMFILFVAIACGDTYKIEGLGTEATGARVKFVQTCATCPTVNVKVGGKLITGASLGYNGTFPNVGYAAFPAGDVNFEFVRADSGTVFLAGKLATATDKYYTVFLNDTLPNQTVFSTEDDIFAAKEDTLGRVRFVHGLTGKTKDTLDVVRKIDNVTVFSGITFGKSTPFIINQGVNPDSFFIRKAGTITVYPGLGSVIGTWAKGRTYTLYARGVTGKTGTPAPGMTFYTNR